MFNWFEYPYSNFNNINIDWLADETRKNTADIEALKNTTIDYDDLINRPEINSVLLTGDRSLEDIGAASADDLDAVSGTVDNIIEFFSGTETPNYSEDFNIDGSTGQLVSAAGISVSDFIPITWSGYARYYNSDPNSPHYQYKIAFYDDAKVFLTNFNNPATAGTPYRNINHETQVTQGEAKYVRISFLKGSVGKITASSSTETPVYWSAGTVIAGGELETIGNAFDYFDKEVNKASIYLGTDAVVHTLDTMNTDNSMVLNEAPWFIKKNVGLSFVGKFAGAFTSLTMGKGYQQYRGKWIVIDGTNITPWENDGNGNNTAGTPEAHGLSITDYIQVAMYMSSDGMCYIAVNTTSGTYNTSFDFGYEWNYAPIVFGGQNMTKVKLSYSCADLRLPLWILGDSYMGVNSLRIGGKLYDLGVFGFCLSAIAGGKAEDTGTPGKSMSNELNKMLDMATPKYLVWELGLNGTKQMNIEYIASLIALCESKNITLILYKPPCIPDVNTTDLNTYIGKTGKRFIDGNDAVGATSAGVWYAGMLAADNTHPTALGAEALAMRFLADCPELMQYGFGV